MKKPKTVENQEVATVIPLHLIPAINHSILGIFQNFKLDWKIDLPNYISLVYLNCKKDHPDSQNCVLAVCFKEFLNTYTVLMFWTLKRHQNSWNYYFENLLMRLDRFLTTLQHEKKMDEKLSFGWQLWNLEKWKRPVFGRLGV